MRWVERRGGTCAVGISLAGSGSVARVARVSNGGHGAGSHGEESEDGGVLHFGCGWDCVCVMGYRDGG